MIIRQADSADLDAIAAIWNHYILTTAHNWRHAAFTPEEIRGWFGAHGAPSHPVLVAEQQGRVVGFGALSTFRASAGYDHTAEDTVYLDPHACGGGIGNALMQALLEQGKKGGLRHVVSMIDSQNVRSIRFHERLGFAVVGVLEDVGYKFDTVLSCVVMQKRL